jgi:hypothetical protein
VIKRMAFLIGLAVALAGCSTRPDPGTAAPDSACDAGATILEVAQPEMEPTLQVHDLVAVVPIGSALPRRDDIVVINMEV